MKTIFCILINFVVISTLIAQQQQKVVINNHLPERLKNAVPVDLNNRIKNKSVGEHNWLNYALQVDQLLANNKGVPSWFTLFPDSNIMVGKYTDGTAAYAYFHMAGTIINPYEMPDNSWIPTTSTSTLDSVAVQYVYSRKIHVTDTLKVYIIKHDTHLDYKMVDNNNKTLAIYQDILYDQPNNRVPDSLCWQTFAFLLTDTDSSTTGKKIYAFKTPSYHLGIGQRIGAIFKFIPGYTYSKTDSVFDKNQFLMLSLEEEGTNTLPLYLTGFNQSYMLYNDVRYNKAGGWNGFFYPTPIWNSAFPYEDHIISYFFTEGAVGFEELSTVNSLSLGQCSPNPVSDYTWIGYELKERSKATIEITDITGKQVMVFDQGTQDIGKYQLKVNTLELDKGIYFYKLTTENGSITKRLVKI